VPFSGLDSSLMRRLGGRVLLGLLVASLCLLAMRAVAEQRSLPQPRRIENEALPRFFFVGNGRLKMRHGHFEEQLDVVYRRADGSYDRTALDRIAHFFRSRADGATVPVPLRLVELLSYLQVAHGVREMILLSGYRSPEFNDALGAQGQAVAFASLHTQALAADLALPGQNLRRLWMKLRDERVGGVGYYASQRFLHVDVGPPRFWEETTSRVSERLSAGNARVFLRTDYDRYPKFEGAELTIHSITALPLRVQKRLFLEDNGRRWLELDTEPASLGRVRDDNGCWSIEEPAPRYAFRVVRAHPLARAEAQARQRGTLVWETCAPRIERTPQTLESNPVEFLLQ
jgi:uncharacterized protein YcbK (DUF882 family)